MRPPNRSAARTLSTRLPDGNAPPAAVTAATDVTGPLTVRQWAGLILTPLLVAWSLWGPAPAGTTQPMRAAAALTAAMATLWVCESIPLAVTALLPLIFLPLARVGTAAEAAASYANDLIFLFIGGFILANGVERCGLHRRLALRVLTLTGTSRPRLVLALMAVTAFISLWISNTATALLMMPVAMSVLRALAPAHGGAAQSAPAPDTADQHFGAAVVVGVSAACTIGGMGTPFGSTPNLLFASLAARLYDIRVGFFHWSLMGIPLVIVFTLLAWWLLTFVLFRGTRGRPSRAAANAGGGGISDARRELGPVRRSEILVGAVFAATALAWVFREPWTIGRYRFGLNVLFPTLTDGTIAIAGAVALFTVPVSLRPGRFVLDWKSGGRIPWDIVLLFGGGLSLADGIQRSGLDRQLVDLLGGIHAMPSWMLLVILCAATVVLSEIASNTATAALLLPLVGAMAVARGEHPLFLMLPLTYAASLGMMLPAATPPNALALATGRVTVPQMMRAGLLLNVIGLVLLLAGSYLLGFRTFGVVPGAGER